MNVSEMVKDRQLPTLRSRDEMVDLLLKEEYGYIHDLDYTMSVSEPEIIEERYGYNTVQHSRINMTITTQYGSHTFPVNRLLHVDGSVNPFFVFLNFRSDVPDRYYPTEELAEAGFDVLSVNYNDITMDNDDFSDGLAGIFLPNGRQTDEDCGKIMYWAWGAMRIMDYAQTLPMLDQNQAAIVGHSRLGKTALVTGMLDQRFRYVISNDSGCSGAALARGNSGLPGLVNYDPDNIYGYERNFEKGETIRDIMMAVPYWFCKNYEKYVYANVPAEFDQHFLLASIAPRYAYIASASFDHWADPVSEFLCGVAASEVYEKAGLKGLVHNEKLPEVGDRFHEGRIGYHLRKGPHFLSRHDWDGYMAFIRKHQFD